MRLNKNGGKIFWGLFFILAAVYIVVGKFWMLPDISVFSVLLTVFFVWLFIKGIMHRNFWEILFPIAFICIIYDEPLGITDLTPWTVLGAALLGSIGLSMIFKPKKNYKFNVNGNVVGGSGVSSEQCSGEMIHCENNFGSQIKYINSDNFRSAHLENNFGTLNVYFDNAVIQGGFATVTVENNFGETVLYIPREWKVQNNITRSFGSISETGRNEGTSENTLCLQGDCSFGSIEIHFV